MEGFVISNSPNFLGSYHNQIHEEWQIGICSCLGNAREKPQLIIRLNLEGLPTTPGYAA